MKTLKVTPQQFDKMREAGRERIRVIYSIQAALPSFAITEDGDGFHFYDTREELLEQHA